MQKTASPNMAGKTPAPLHPRELVLMMASLMALNALAIDTMLPAFPQIAGGFALNGANGVQYVISAYLAGMGVGSLFYGPLSDRYGRRRILLPAMIGYVLFSLACSQSPSFNMLIFMRVMQGVCGAAMGVLVAAIIRDQFSGDIMARHMSVIFMTFMIVPIIAPSVGALILTMASWGAIFDLFALLGLITAIWVWRRLPETLAEENILPVHFPTIIAGWRSILGSRLAMSYVLAAGMSQGALFGYLNSSEQLFGETFGARDFFPIGFAIIAMGIAVANFTNARIVERYGARRVSHSAVFIFIALGAGQIAASVFVPKSMALFLVLITANMALIGFLGSNFSAIAMQPFGRIAGTASSFQQSMRTFLAAGIGAMIGQQFDGTVTPIGAGFCICGIVALISIFWGEHGQLFTRPRTAPKSPI